MKKLISLLAVVLVSMATLPTQAATATNTFNVGITLTSACEITTVPTAAFTYTSFQTLPSTISSSFNLRCTNSLPISSITLDLLSVTDTATNLAYTLALGTLPTAGNGLTGSTVTVTGSMAGGQAGTCLTATCTNAASTNKTRTLTLVY